MPKQPKGRPTNGRKIRISAALPEPLFRRVRTRAAKKGKTVSETIATLCSIGLADLDQGDRFEHGDNSRFPFPRWATV
jgi:hypothetical protein